MPQGSQPTLVPWEALPPETFAPPPAKEAAGSSIVDRLKSASPEIAGLIAGVGGTALGTPALGAIAAPVAAGATAGIRDWLDPDADVEPSTIAGHAAVNALPTAIRGAGKGLRLAVSSAPGKVTQAVSALLRRGAPAAAAPAASGLASMTLPGGIKVASPEGLQALQAIERQLSLSGKAFGDPQFDAINALIGQVRTALQNPSAQQLLAQAVPGAARQGVSAAGKEQGIVAALRALLAGGALADTPQPQYGRGERR